MQTEPVQQFSSSAEPRGPSAVILAPRPRPGAVLYRDSEPWSAVRSLIRGGGGGICAVTHAGRTFYRLGGGRRNGIGQYRHQSVTVLANGERRDITEWP